MAHTPVLREVVYRVEFSPERGSTILPVVLSREADVSVETTVTHLDDTGRVWRILNVDGAPHEMDRALAVFREYRPPHLVEKSVLGRTKRRLILWYKYTPPSGPESFSHTALAFRLLGRDTVITDRARKGELHIRILCRNTDGLRKFVSTIRRDAPAHQRTTVVYVGPPRELDESGLSRHEEDTLVAASRLGYFGVPRKAGVREVAGALGISASAASARLRMAERKLVAAYLERG